DLGHLACDPVIGLLSLWSGTAFIADRQARSQEPITDRLLRKRSPAASTLWEQPLVRYQCGQIFADDPAVSDGFTSECLQRGNLAQRVTRNQFLITPDGMRRSHDFNELIVNSQF